MLPFIVNGFRIFWWLSNQYNHSFIEHLEIPGQRSEVRRSATPSSPVSDTTDSSTQHKKVAVDIQGAGKESRINCVILIIMSVNVVTEYTFHLPFWKQLGSTTQYEMHTY